MNMDDTEDEEVKKNCFGKMHYTETSEEDEDSDAESTMSSNSIKFFVNHKPSGKGVFQPKPIVLDRIVEQREPSLKKIIHNECEFSDDEEEEEEEEEEENDYEKGDDALNISKSKSGEFTSEREYTTNTGSEEDADEDEEEEAESDESDDDGALETSEILTEDEDDGEADDDDNDDDDDSEEESVEDELEDSSISDSGDGVEKYEYIGVSDDNDQGLPVEFETAHEFVSNSNSGAVSDVNVDIDVNDDGSISADTIEDIIEKKDVSDILFSDEEDGEDISSPAQEGTDLDEDEMFSFLAEQTQEPKEDLSHLKRSYSKQEFTQISPEEGFMDHKRNCRRLSQKAMGLQDTTIPFIPTLSLGRSALAKDDDYGAQDFDSYDKERGNGDENEDDDDEEVDHQLAEELMDGITSKDLNVDSSPIPLLTPPASPTPFEISNSSNSDNQKVIVCEWPSNMAVDNALTAVNELRPMSPSSLEKLEEESMKREDFMTPTSMYQNRSRSISDVSSGLTPNFGNLNMANL
jgi:hypothetical protein